jgi:hypothetical protein
VASETKTGLLRCLVIRSHKAGGDTGPRLIRETRSIREGRFEGAGWCLPKVHYITNTVQRRPLRVGFDSKVESIECPAGDRIKLIVLEQCRKDTRRNDGLQFSDHCLDRQK